MKTLKQVRHVLVVDDDPAIRTVLAIGLEMSDFSVAAAVDAAEAEMMARRLAPHVIVLDWMMPGVDGVSLLRTLKADERTRDIPVIMLTAKASDADVLEGWQAGASYYMTKPFDIDQLIAFIESLSQPDDEGSRL